MAHEYEGNMVDEFDADPVETVKLFGFYPGVLSGPLSFFVAAASLHEAKTKIDEYIAKHKPGGFDAWPEKYEVAEVEVGVVLINCNE